MKQIFAAGIPEKMPAANSDIGRIMPLFVVGMPRSGTTLVEQILAAHPYIQTAGELTTIAELASEMQLRFETTQAYPEALNELTADNLNEMAQDYLQRLSRDISHTAGKTVCVIDKMPANFLNLGFVSRLFPQAAVIHCSRDAWDIALSCYMRSFSGQGLAFSNDLGNIGAYYNGYQDLMALWNTVFQKPIIDVVYERLVAEPENEIGRILDSLQLDHDDACLRFYENTGMVATASTAQVRKPTYHTSVGKAKNYREWLEPLLEPLLGPMMDKPG